jgi:ATP-dependent protease HslVU (ClpYQ) peptidase subunit
MTCIVTLSQKGTIWMGGDSALTDDMFMQFTRVEPKVFINEGMIIGYAGSARLGNVLRYSFVPPVRTRTDKDLMKYMVTKFVDSLRTLTREKGLMHKEEIEEIYGHILVGIEGRIFAIYEDWQVAEPREPYLAIGGGTDLALGSLFSTEKMAPRDRVTQALSAAARYNASVRPPFVIESLPSTE